jgi:CMP-N-acetylneuraminic acid synthetase
LAVVPARGGSVRLNRKNLALLNGRPLVAYAVHCARQCGLFDAVFVATDDPEIARESVACGALVPELMPPELAGGDQPSHAASLWMARYLVDGGRQADSLFTLEPTSPLRLPADITEAWEAFRRGDFEHLVSVSEVDPQQFHWAMERAGRYWKLFFGTLYQKERAELPPFFYPNGAILLSDLQALERDRTPYGAKLAAIEMPRERSVRVTTRLDLKVAELLMKDLGEPDWRI